MTVLVRRPARTAGLVVLLAAFGVLLGPARTGDAAGAESIPSYVTAVDLRSDGRMRVTETITYDFGGNQRHGIIRRIPAVFRYNDSQDRVYPISDVSVTRDGRSEPVDTSSSGGYVELKIGDPDRTISGRHTYVIGYTVAGAVNRFPDHDELYWNLVGTEWTVPIASATATVTGPAAITKATCFAGPDGSRLGCASSTVRGATATFTQSGLAAGSGLSAAVALPPATVAGPGPILVEHRDLATAFAVTPGSIAALVVLPLLGLAVALGLAWWIGRDRRYVGTLPGLVPEPGESTVEERKSLIGAPPVSVEFGPPDNLRPGQVGTIVDEQANVVDVTASIVDLAVRKHLRIKELPAAKAPDWELKKLTEGDPRFLPYERRLFDALFHDRTTVRLSELRGTFSTELTKVRHDLYDDVVRRGWYRTSPQRTRFAARLIAIAGLVVALLVTLVLALATHAGLVGLGLVLATIPFIALAGRFPARTGRGSAVLARVQGFRLYIATAEVEQLAFAERAQIFSEFLPYAMVFGLTERWARVFASLGDQAVGQLYWYSGHPGLTAAAFAYSFGSFTTMTSGAVATSGAIATSNASASGFSAFSGGGFSGGGGGGGGGGSW